MRLVKYVLMWICMATCSSLVPKQVGSVILKTEMQLNKSTRKETLLFLLEVHENCGGVSEKYIGYRPTVIITCID